jgi:hypothetical protein
VKRTRETITSRPCGGYRLWEAVIVTAHGRRFEGYGYGPDARRRASQNARRKAQEARQ